MCCATNFFDSWTTSTSPKKQQATIQYKDLEKVEKTQTPWLLLMAADWGEALEFRWLKEHIEASSQ